MKIVLSRPPATAWPDPQRLASYVPPARVRPYYVLHERRQATISALLREVTRR